MPRLIRIKGGALISALFITAIAAIIAVALAVQQRVLIHESELVLNADQSYLNCQGMQIVAENAVKKYVSQWTNTKNLPAQLIPLKNKLPTIKINNMILTGNIDDEQGKFNLNDLVYTSNQPRFVALLQAVVQGISQKQSYNIAKAITAWISNNSQDPYYLSLHPAYRTPQNKMANISELHLISGITPDIYSALEPYVTALPVAPSSQPPASGQAAQTTQSLSATLININNALAPVLLTMNPAMTLPQAKSIVACRKRYGEVTNVKTFMTTCVQPVGITTLNDAATTSNYFLAQTQADYYHHLVSLNSLLVTQLEKNNKLKVVVVWQSFE